MRPFFRTLKHDLATMAPCVCNIDNIEPFSKLKNLLSSTHPINKPHPRTVPVISSLLLHSIAEISKSFSLGESFILRLFGVDLPTPLSRCRFSSLTKSKVDHHYLGTLLKMVKPRTVVGDEAKEVMAAKVVLSGGGFISVTSVMRQVELPANDSVRMQTDSISYD